MFRIAVIYLNTFYISLGFKGKTKIKDSTLSQGGGIAAGYEDEMYPECDIDEVLKYIELSDEPEQESHEFC